jgi:hypothetical protein
MIANNQKIRKLSSWGTLRFDKPRLRARYAAPARKPGTVDEIFSAENLAQPIEKARF